MNSSKERPGTIPALGKCAIAILLIAGALRFVGIGFGMPHWLVNDELPLIGGALRMLELRNPIPSMNPQAMAILYYPPAVPWLYLVIWAPILAIRWAHLGFPALQVFAESLLTDLNAIWLSSRAVSALCGVATVWVVMRLASEVFQDRRAGLIAGALQATSFHHLLVDHFARVWSPAVLLFWCGLWAAWRVYAKGERRDYVFAAVAAGLGFAGNYVPVLTSIAVAVAHLARHRRLAVDRSILLYAAIVAAFIAVVLAASWHDFIRLGGYSAVLGPAVVASGSGQ